MATAAEPERCGQMMVRAGVPCYKPKGHKGNHQSEQSLRKGRGDAQAKPTYRSTNNKAVQKHRNSAEWRKKQRERSEKQHTYKLKRHYGLTPEDYWSTYSFQAGKCAICCRATGRTKRLAVDHDHKCPTGGHDPKMGCPDCVRGLLCGPCNKLLGQLRDSPEALERAARYLREPPFQILRRRQQEQEAA